MKIIINWLIFTFAIIIAAYLLPGVTVNNFIAALIAALILGLINAVIKPILLVLTLPINILTLGLFTLVINAVLILLASWIVPGFNVAGFWQALLFGIVLSAISYILDKIF
ncbi:phage holin family protein [Candidatus Parcubacteria bacterium]|nr:MAG: phage holin family protein [Candidatus Parcubacteria bacterium]